MSKFGEIVKISKVSFRRWIEKDPFRQSAVVAYYAIFSLPALLVLIISTAGLFFGADAVNKSVMSQVSNTMGAETSEQISGMLEKAKESKDTIWATILGVITLLFGASGVFVQLQITLNLIWGVEGIKSNGIKEMLKTRLLSFGLILSIAFLLLISLVVSTLLASFGDWISADRSDIILLLFQVLEFLISILVISILFGLMFKTLPDTDIKWREVIIGSILTGVLFTIGKSLLSIYFGKAEPGSGYGAAGSIILILLWVSYSSMIMFLGAEFTRAYADMYSGYKAPVQKKFAGEKDSSQENLY